MRLLFLVEDKAPPSFRAEHGLSILIIRDERYIIFDTGASDTFINNAGLKGIDLSRVTDVVISHGHHDHINGLPALTRIHKGFNLWVRKEAFIPKYSGKRYAGPSWKPEDVKNMVHLEWVEDETKEIAEGVYVYGPAPMKEEYERISEKFLIRTSDDIFHDTFEDEIYLVVEEDDHLVLITGCSHRGIVNIINGVEEKFGKHVSTVVGGLHLWDASHIRLHETLKALNNSRVDTLAICHCTGDKAIEFFHKHFRGEVLRCETGYELTL